MENSTLSCVNYPNVISKYNTAYDFEIFDVPKTVSIMSALTPWIFVLCLVYIGSIFALQLWMKNKAPFELKNPLIFWNLGLAIFSIIGLARQLPEVFGIWRDKGFYNVACVSDDHNYATTYWQLLFTLSKIIEFGDTIFLALRKKKIIFLHWFHHATVLFFSWITFITNDPAVRRGGSLNYFVHSIMYTYFAMRAMDFKFPNWFAKTITRVQIFQFAFAIAGNFYTLSLRTSGIQCNRPLSNELYILMVAVVYCVLFVNFFKNAYGSKGKASQKLE